MLIKSLQIMEAVRLILLLAFLIVTVSSQCEQQVTCEGCIVSSPRCAWCSDEATNITVRCFDRARPTSICNTIEDPQSNVVGQQGLLSEDDLVSPRKVNITLRPGVSTSFNVTVQSARNFPLDLYLLIDTSGSLSDDVATLRILSSNITQSISNISSNFKIGFGTFVDKPTLPYSPIVDPLDGVNCINNINECVRPYSFRHILSLTDNEDKFSSELDRTANTSYGADAAEAGFDSILQAVVCPEIIGWRARATRIILFVSDGVSHVAGDGRLAAIVKPNDGECHLSVPDNSEFYEYDQWAVSDYASFGQLEEKLRSFDTSVIVAVDSSSQNYYEGMITNSNRMFLSLLEPSSTNIINIIETQYEILVDTVLLEPVPIPGVRVSVEPVEGCNDIGLNGECRGVSVEQTVIFTVTVTADVCVTSGNSFDVRVRGFGSIEVTVEPLCNCGCEQNAVSNSPKCRNGTGTSVCGICMCGDFDGQGTFDCPASISSNTQCSGHGQCTTCGECKCERINGNDYYFGSACECDTFTCGGRDSQGRICRGNGLCCNGRCMCSVNQLGEALYTGSQCQCTFDNRTCLNQRGEVCSNHGSCVCGVSQTCLCTDDYFGEYCDRCIGESCQPCNLYPNCVQCELGSSTIDCTNCSQVSIVSQDDGFANATDCNSLYSTCNYQYLIQRDDMTGQHSIYINRNPISCVDAASIRSVFSDWWWLLLAILIPILIIIFGIIALIIIKICIVLKDKRELKKFRSEVHDASWADVANPLYVTPVSEYPNVAYKPKNKKKTIQE